MSAKNCLQQVVAGQRVNHRLAFRASKRPLGTRRSLKAIEPCSFRIYRPRACRPLTVPEFGPRSVLPLVWDCCLRDLLEEKTAQEIHRDDRSRNERFGLSASNFANGAKLLRVTSIVSRADVFTHPVVCGGRRRCGGGPQRSGARCEVLPCRRVTMPRAHAAGRSSSSPDKHK